MFPSEFKDLLTEKGLELLNSEKPVTDVFTHKIDGAKPLLILEDVIDIKVLSNIVQSLEKDVTPHLKTDSLALEIPYYDSRESYVYPLTFRRNYYFYSGENTKVIGAKQSLAEVLEELNILKCLTSKSYYDFLEKVTGVEFSREGDGVQCNRYKAGDYMAMHTDFLNRKYNTSINVLPKMCLNVTMNFFENVLNQYLLVESMNGQMNTMVNTCDEKMRGSLMIYALPMYHQVLPLMPINPDEKSYRWLIMGEAYFSERQVDKLIREYPNHTQIKQMTAHIKDDKLQKLLTKSAEENGVL
jgi:hypothetical protein